MIREVRWHPGARDETRELKRRSREDSRRIGRAIDRFVTSGQGDVTKLTGRRGEYRLRRRQPPPNEGLVDWLLACPEKGYFVPIESESTDTL